MDGEKLKLKNPPIIEAVVDIDCDMPAGHSVLDLETRATEIFAALYPIAGRQVVERLTWHRDEEGKLLHEADKDVSAIRFTSTDEKQIVQVRPGGFSFNRLAPYGSFDDYEEEIGKRWHDFVALAGPLLVRETRLRYVNRIPVPFDGQAVDLDLYFNNAPRLPDGTGLVMSSFLLQCTAVETISGSQASLTLAMQPAAEGVLPIIFDIQVRSDTKHDPLDWEGIKLKLEALRAIKNRIFWEALTEKCRQLFQ